MKDQEINQIVADFIALHRALYADSLNEQVADDVWSSLQGGRFGEVRVDDEGWSQIEVGSHASKSGNPIIFEYKAPNNRRPKMKNIYDIANKLTNEDMVTLIHIFSDRIIIARRTGVNESTTDDLDRDVACCLNGATIQLNVSGMFDDDPEEEN
jgi:hypothetical protein